MSSPAQDSCRGVPGLGVARQPAIAPDGRHAVRAERRRDRDPRPRRRHRRAAAARRRARLHQREGTADGCAVDPRVAGATALVASADGRHVYATGPGGIVTLDRAADGGLAVRGCILTTGRPGVRRALPRSPGSPTRRSARTGRTSWPPISPPARASPSSPATRRRRPARAPGPRRVPQAARGRRRLPAHPAMGSDTHVAFGGDQQLYLGGFTTSAVADASSATSRRVRADRGVRRPQHAAPVPACRAPTPTAIRWRSPSGPAPLRLARGDRRGAGQGHYDPFGGFSGPDGFTYGARPPARSGAARARRWTSRRRPRPAAAAADRLGGPTRWGVRGKRIFLLSLAVRRPPAGARLELRCRAGSGRRARSSAARSGAARGRSRCSSGRGTQGGDDPGAPLPRRPAAAGARHRAGADRQGRRLPTSGRARSHGRPALPAAGRQDAAQALLSVLATVATAVAANPPT